MKLRCCPVCYRMVKPTISGTGCTGTKIQIRYTIRCPPCMFGCDKVGSVLVDYDEETMTPIADDYGLRKIMNEWNSILRDPERERLADI